MLSELNDFFQMEITTKNLTIWTYLYPNFPIEAVHIPETHQARILAKTIYNGVYLYYLWVCELQNVIWFCIQLINKDTIKYQISSQLY